MKKLLVLISVLAVAGSAAAIIAATAVPAGTTSAKRATLKLRSGSLGKFVVDAKGRTLYEFEKDSSRRSACSGACARNWPPVLSAGKPHVGTGLSAGKAGTIRRANGSRQATYGGHPLYRFVGDGMPGDTNGQDVNAFGAKWYVVAASGHKIDPEDAPKSAQAPSDSGSSGYGYGY